MDEELELDYEKLANFLIDDYVEMHGLSETIEMLLGTGLTADELINDLHFDAADVVLVLANA